MTGVLSTTLHRASAVEFGPLPHALYFVVGAPTLRTNSFYERIPALAMMIWGKTISPRSVGTVTDCEALVSKIDHEHVQNKGRTSSREGHRFVATSGNQT